jgi:hypothetical protein
MQRTNATLLTGVNWCVSYPPPPPFPNTKYKCDIICWNSFLFQRILPSPFQIQNTNATLLTGVILLRIITLPPPPFPKCKVQMRHYLLELIFALANTSFFPNTKAKSNIIY